MSKDRVEHIDIAKGIGICLVVAGHTLEVCGELFNLIFAFHMPLFVILSGMTLKKSDSTNDFVKRTIKDAKVLLTPFLLCNVLYFLNLVIVKSKGVGLAARVVANDMFFKNEGGVNNYAIWFLIALFLSKAIYRLVELYFSNTFVVYLLLAYFGMRVGVLPLYLDIALVMTLFLYIGAKFRTYNKWDYANKPVITEILTIACFVVFILLKEKGTTMYMYERVYTNSLWSIVVGVCGSVIVIELSKTIEKVKIISSVLKTIGSFTIYILAVHFIDGFVYPFTKTSNITEIVVRIVVDVVVAFIVSWLVRFIKTKLQW